MSLALAGVWTALVTPFTSGGAQLDLASLERLVEFQISNGVAGLVPCGSTGESVVLNDAEYAAVVGTVVRVARGRVPVMAGAGSSSTQRSQELAQIAAQNGADALLVVVPPYNKPSQQGIAAHYRSIHESTSLPIIAYNVPGRTVVGITADTVAELFADGTIAGIKEASGALALTLDIVERTAGKLPILSGEDGLIFPIMACGGVGVISVVSNVIPQRVVTLVRQALAKESEMALKEQIKLLPWVRAAFSETNPVPIKAALALAGLLSTNTVRLPLIAASPSTQTNFSRLLELR